MVFGFAPSLFPPQQQKFFVARKNPKGKTAKHFKREDFYAKTRKSAIVRLTPVIALFCESSFEADTVL